MTLPDRAGAPPFRPVRGTWVSVIVGLVVLIGSLVLAAWLPADVYGTMDRLICAGVGVAVAVFLSRFATINALPLEEGLWVRNLGPGELVRWEHIEAVRFSQGMPWPIMDLFDGTDVAVMAIQRADGPKSLDEAQRLADLVGR